jgi:hypothetical protein
MPMGHDKKQFQNGLIMGLRKEAFKNRYGALIVKDVGKITPTQIRTNL